MFAENYIRCPLEPVLGLMLDKCSSVGFFQFSNGHYLLIIPNLEEKVAEDVFSMLFSVGPPFFFFSNFTFFLMESKKIQSYY